ncbi:MULTISPECIES: tonB-system energizer ExbB [Bradyrhizobium]|uniref:Biopolymer transport protein ExbB n=3 Tax=Bradyrhizobium diazoefficiens TaxID=1355477 RepID=Q89ND6_BRADU|nr:tonB-system energizer ExbB [Bradyrhizobium diazoefficiens]AND89224.1 ABC transporter ATPase [Bradyrhizobium diazoefficiens USDA 110]AWO90851.1 tonB-system energizer ExbB [Bradyrhizobium diazoefficiens]PDT60856.1 tonB-system energizer ExbB [Bradyrhizobium diazoefficiens]QBP22678.1 tonB-system energizer ExbB [Bradyrhizobium diazoefficiens]QLD44362.1 tonB-system energizer ExbB [Bradyrhizobium diazoefficiens]
MKIMSFQASRAAVLMLAAAWLASPVSAQTQTPPAAPAQSTARPAPISPVPAAPSTPAPAVPAPAASTATAPAAATASPAAIAPATAKPDAASATAPAMKELSPWVMFMSADVIVKAVMIGLAFASLMTWTVLIAKSIELSVASGRLRSALKKISEARSLAEAQMALGTKEGILPSFLAAALREARMSAGLSSDAGIKERAASSFSEIVRAEARRIRIGMGVLATIGSTSPFVGLFGTVWGIMNSFIGISKSQTTNLAVVAPGIAEALLATAIGLVAAIPAVIIYNHFSRVTKSYLELVSRASGAAGRLLSRDLDRSHGSVHSRAAE